jgi:hypothetical protein
MSEALNRMGVTPDLAERLVGARVSPSPYDAMNWLQAAETFKDQNEVQDFLRSSGADPSDFGDRTNALSIVLAVPAALRLTAEEMAGLIRDLAFHPAYAALMPQSFRNAFLDASDESALMLFAAGLYASTQDGAVRWLLDEGFSGPELAEFFVYRPTGPLREALITQGLLTVPAFVRCDLLHLARERSVPLADVALLHDWWGTAEEIILALESGMPLDYAREALNADTPDFDRLGIRFRD